MTIDTITLSDVVPDIFANDPDSPIARSGIWGKNITLERGQHYLVVAESGTGKSSLCSFIYGNRNDYAGRILFNNTDIRTYGIAKWCDLRRTALALLPQEMRIFPELTAMENIQIKNRLTNHLSVNEIRDMMQRLGILDKADTPAAIMSIGQQQRVAIIRALAQPFSFILLDEPVSHLDARNNRIVADMILQHAHRQQAAIITTSVGNHLLIDDFTTIRL